MQQLYLSGERAPELAQQLINALNLRPAGYQLTPFTVGGGLRGEALRLLTPPAAPMDNDVPCRIRLRSGDWAVVPRVLDEIAAPNLLRAVPLQTPILLGSITAQMLTCAAFREAVVQLLTSERLVIAAVSDDAEEHLRALTSTEGQMWFPVPESSEARALLLQELAAEVTLRL